MRVIEKKTTFLILTTILLFSTICVLTFENSYAAKRIIHLKKGSITISAGKLYQQKLIDRNGKTIKATKVRWKSRKTSVAKISKKGRIKSIKAGTVRMTAKYKGKTYRFTVHVKKPFSSTARPKIKSLWYGDSILEIKWKGLKNATRYDIYLSEEGGPYKLRKKTKRKGIDLYVDDIIDRGHYKVSVKVIARAGAHKSKYSSNKTVYLIDKYNIANYIKTKGEPFDSSYIYGDYCISEQSTRYDEKGIEYIDTYTISTYANNSEMIYFGLNTIKLDPKVTSDHYTQEYTNISYDKDVYISFVSFTQKYWWDFAGKKEWSYYYEKCSMDCCEYDYNKGGLYDFTIGKYNEENTNPEKEIISRTTRTMRGIDDLLKNKFNSSLYDIGFFSS